MTYKKSEQTVLCLTTTDSKKLTKAFDKKRISTTGTASSFIHSEPQVPNVEVLYYLLNKIQDDPCTVIVSGVLTGDSRKLKTISRKKEHIIDKKRAWFCLDIDSFELPSDKDVINEPASCVKHFVNTSLPTEFRNTQYVYQLSSSCGVKSRHLLKAHLFFMLEKPMELKDIKQTLSSCEHIDPSTLSPTQMIFVAKPIFEQPADDPYAGKNRIGLVQANKDSPTVLLSLQKTNFKKSTKVVKKTDSTSIYDALPRLRNDIGDGDGKLGFYEPIRRYTACIVTTMWHSYVLEHIDNLKILVREEVNHAEVSEYRDSKDIERYSSDEFLDGLIYGAINKDFGNKNRENVDAKYQNYPIDLFNATHSMADAFKTIRNPLIENIQNKSKYTNVEVSNKKNFTKLIRATAGLGKTFEVIYYLNKFLTIERPIPISFELYVPSHRLGSEIIEAIRKYKLLLQSSPYKTKIEASHIVGRTQSKNGTNVCKRKSEVEEATSLGVAVGKELCGEHLKEDDENRCGHFNQCEYQKQFRAWKERQDEQHVYIMSHDYLFIKRREGIPRPDLVIIDETFYGKSIKEITIEQPLAIFNKYAESSVIDAIRQYTIQESNLLEIFRNNNVTPNEIRNLAKSFKKREDDGERKYLAFDIILEGLADELDTYPNRKESRLLKVGKQIKEGEQHITLEYRKRRDLTVPTDTPLLMIDADGDKDIAQLFRKENQIEYEEISAERNAIVYQFTDRTWSRNSLLNKEELKQQTLRFLQDVTASDDKTVIVMDKQLLDKFGFRKEKMTVNGESSSRYYCNNSPVIHFGGFRGSNEFKDYNNIVIIGRSEPSVQNMENQAAALWYDDDKDITILPDDASGHVNYPKSKVAYRMDDGSIETAEVSRHPDERVDKLLRLARESESTQAIDRLRSVRSENQKTVWLLCNIPLDITVNHLLKWDRYQTLIETVSTEDCFVVHRDFHYFKVMEQSARSRNIRKWQSMHFANRASISQMHKTQFSVMNDSNSPFIAFISTKYNGSKEELIASKLGLSEESIAVERMDMKSN